MMMNRFLTGVAVTALSLACITPVLASGASRMAMRKQVEMNMLLSGTIDVKPDGSVASYHIDQGDSLPEGVTRLIANNVPNWTFEPVLVDGMPVLARARMGLNIVATHAGEDKHTVRIDSASFGDAEEDRATGESVSSGKMDPPRYPDEAASSNMTGIAYVLLKVDQQGQVADAVVEQVNLTVLGDAAQLKRARDIFSRATLRAARNWTFTPPRRGELADDPFWVVRVPVDYQLYDGARPPKDGGPTYGKWRAYVPGPRTKVPWKDGPQESAAFKPDAMLAGMSYTAGSGLQLLTPLGD